ncbi:MAG: PDZ domain-containing protein [Planctomycetes bacterium]|nr:PDZ domain-containing protein [Planctomycetota bacterium]
MKHKSPIAAAVTMILVLSFCGNLRAQDHRAEDAFEIIERIQTQLGEIERSLSEIESRLAELRALLGVRDPLSEIGVSVASSLPESLGFYSPLADYLPETGGVLVTRVDPDSSAAKAGMRANTVILSIGGSAVSTPSDARRILRKFKAGDVVTFEMFRPTSGLPPRYEIDVTCS